jgi:hypothetical protein
MLGLSPSASFAKPSTLGRSMSRSTAGQSIPPRGGRGSYSMASCTRGHLVARQPAGKAQGSVDACGHAGTCQVSAIPDPAFCDVPRSQPVKESTVCPVSGGGTTLQEAGSGEQQGACAHRGYDFGGAVGLPQIVEEDWIRQLAKRGGAATWNQDDIRRGNVVEGV